MEFLLICLDRTDSTVNREDVRRLHLEFILDKQDHFRYAGPLLTDDDEMIGSVWILNFPDRAALDAYMQEDPYFTSGLYEKITIYRTRQVAPELVPGELKKELEKQKAKDAARATGNS